MRALKYRLASGEIVSTMAEAKRSGQAYEEMMVNIKESKAPDAPKRAHILATVGVVR